ncbi:MAG TPA: sorbosone dehydrogenase family protein [Anaerolineales bacterium]|nr:sorbosone dehydrogenase family protein [Anaerolineales bacterium]
MNKKSNALDLLVRLGLIVVLAAVLAGCAKEAQDPSVGYGPDPQLPAPDHSVVPVLNAPNAIGWDNGDGPVAAQGLAVGAFASGLDHPRWLYVLPNGDVLVAETNAPKRPDDAKGIKGMIFKFFQRNAGAGVPSANRITLLRDADGDGAAEVRTVFLDGLNSPFGMALVGNTFYVANTDAVLAFPYEEGQTEITAEGTKITDLPAGTLNHHWTKGLIANTDGSKLYVSVGSNSNVAENGIEQEKERAAILEVDTQTGAYRVFASGLRNPVGMAREPESGALWAVVNERDELGNDLVPDYMTAVQDGGFYGWPYSYFGEHVDTRVEPQNPDLVAAAIVPDYALGSHTAPLGLASSVGNSLPEQFANGMFVGQHGSWNRVPHSGYQVIFIPFTGGMPSGDPVLVLSGFVEEDGDAKGRPVGVALDGTGALLVADDVGNVIWRVTAAQ